MLIHVNSLSNKQKEMKVLYLTCFCYLYILSNFFVYAFGYAFGYVFGYAFRLFVVLCGCLHNILIKTNAVLN